MHTHAWKEEMLNVTGPKENTPETEIWCLPGRSCECGLIQVLTFARGWQKIKKL